MGYYVCCPPSTSLTDYPKNIRSRFYLAVGFNYIILVLMAPINGISIDWTGKKP